MRQIDLLPHPKHARAQVLEGYIFLGNTTQLGSEVTVAYTNAMDAAVLAAARLTIVAHCGGPERAKGITSLQEAIKGMPANVMRICLAKVIPCSTQSLTKLELSAGLCSE